MWVNNCVGHFNYRYFLAYLVANIWLLGYGFRLTHGVLKVQVKKANLSGSTISRWRNVCLLDELKPTTCLMLLCGIMIWLVLAFLIEHMRYMYLGVTTNESGKWEDVQYCIEDGTVYTYYYPDTQKPSELCIVMQKLPDGLFNRSLTPEEQRIVNDQHLELKQVPSVRDITNIYDKGFKQNFKDRVFPASI